LVARIEDWEFSSFRDYCGLRNGTLCDKEVAYQELSIDKEKLYSDSYNTIEDFKVKLIF
jgi:hypothetical protein